MNITKFSSLVLLAPLALSACAGPQPLNAFSAEQKLSDANIACTRSEDVGSLLCYDETGEQYNIIIYGLSDSTPEEIAAQMDDDLAGMCESPDSKYDKWAEGVNWRAYSTATISSEEFASALGGSVKTRAADCN